jgi:hypothetical protein
MIVSSKTSSFTSRICSEECTYCCHEWQKSLSESTTSFMRLGSLLHKLPVLWAKVQRVSKKTVEMSTAIGRRKLESTDIFVKLYWCLNVVQMMSYTIDLYWTERIVQANSWSKLLSSSCSNWS